MRSLKQKASRITSPETKVISLFCCDSPWICGRLLLLSPLLLFYCLSYFFFSLSRSPHLLKYEAIRLWKHKGDLFPSVCVCDHLHWKKNGNDYKAHHQLPRTDKCLCYASVAYLKHRQDETHNRDKRTLAIKLSTKTSEHGQKVVKSKTLISFENFNSLDLT